MSRCPTCGLDSDPWLSAEQVASLTHFSEDAILKWAAEGRLPSFQVGRHRRFLLSEVDAWRESQRFSPKQSNVVQLRSAGGKA